ncbi:UDP-N-acetylmuramate--alanine ligase [Erysipelotrichaceae bacterium MTC7]|nr:UDP-N-acetylmuramate--alanine ligase [Erysipelotrichaceae bacterium MTC7]
MIHFVGIKGSGMASLACILKDMGEEVDGSDIEKFIFTETKLKEHKIPFFAFGKENIKDHMTVIIGNSFDDSNVEVQAAKANPTVTVYKYVEYLGKLVDEYHSICVAGTHGKTTTTGMLAHVFEQVQPTGYLIGDGTGYMPKQAKTFVLESCEYMRNFLNYHPDYAIILNVELDHVDYYKDMDDYVTAFEQFSQNVKKGLAIFGDEPSSRNLHVSVNHMYYGLHDDNDVYAKDVVEDAHGVSFTCMVNNEEFHRFQLPYYGVHLLYNALGVITLGVMNGLDGDTLEQGLQSFAGVDRRFIVEEVGEQVYIDDYAHHPTAIKMTIDAAKQKYPNKKIVAIFQPDRYSRIAYFIDDFADAFAKADDVYLCPFPDNAVREPGITVTNESFLAHVPQAKACDMSDAAIKGLDQLKPAVYLFMSSKDIYKFKDRMKNFQNV